MARKPKKNSRYIDRGLPFGYDPLAFYEYRVMDRASRASGVEGLLYKLIPHSLIKSFAFAIDPFSQFKVVSGRIAPVQRSRTRSMSSVLDQRRLVKTNRYFSEQSIPNYFGVGGYGPVQQSPGTPSVSVLVTPLRKQDVIPWNSKDTTYSTRSAGYTMGEFEKVRSELYSPPRQIRYVYDSDYKVSLPVGMPNILRTRSTTDYTFEPSGAYLLYSDYAILEATEKLELLSIMDDNAISMYRGLNPQFRNYSLFRNVVELRDLPRSISQLAETARHLREFETLFRNAPLEKLREIATRGGELLKDVPKEYVSYCFGWRQLYSDIKGLLVKPEHISKQINLLIKRSGKPTTYRTTRKLTGGAEGVPGFTYENNGYEYEVKLRTSLVREIQLDMVVNTSFEFPITNDVKFKSDMFYSKLGAVPRATDIYNLVPWSWLVDWFTGLGNYIEIIDEVNHDPSLVNWGFLTGKSAVKVVSNYASKTDSYSQKYGDVNSFSTIVESHNHSSVLEINLQFRRDVRNLMSVNTTSDVSSLSTYQKSILGSLLSMKVTRKH